MSAKWTGGKLVIVNLQKTLLDPMANIIIHARIQTVFTKLMEKLEIPIPKFKLIKWAKVSLKNSQI